MSAEEILEAIGDLLGKHDGDELELMEALCDTAISWRMRRDELRDEDDEG